MQSKSENNTTASQKIVVNCARYVIAYHDCNNILFYYTTLLKSVQITSKTIASPETHVFNLVAPALIFNNEMFWCTISLHIFTRPAASSKYDRTRKNIQ